MNILIAADLVPTRSNEKKFEDNNLESLLGEKLLRIWNEANFRIFNLEAPITNISTPIAKLGPNIKIRENTLNGIIGLKPSLILLANNHIMDHGEQGYYKTKEILKRNSIKYIGMGDNLEEAADTHTIIKNDIKVGVYNLSENEFSGATTENPGANTLNVFKSFKHIKDLKEKSDLVIVVFHGGKEHYQYPSPFLQQLCRAFVDNGADLVICQHSHVIGCEEVYNNKTIVYGQGNFIFDYSENLLWQESLIINVNIKNSSSYSLSYYPIVKKGNTVKLAEEHKSQKILSEFQKRSHQIKSNDFVANNYKKFVEANRVHYLYTIFGFGKWISRLDNRILNGFLLKKTLKSSKLLPVLNYLQCESHFESVLSILNEEVRKNG